MARDYDIAESSGLCSQCGRQLAAGEEYVAVLVDRGEKFGRDDFCTACWEAAQAEPKQAFCVWRGRVPAPTEPKSRTVDNEVLIEFFNKLDGFSEPAKVNFRFVLALMLMRKRLLVHKGSSSDEAGRDVWKMVFRHDRTPVEVIHPELDEAMIAEVTAQLGAILEGPT